MVLNRWQLENQVTAELDVSFPKEVYVWIHFGGTDLNLFTADKIREDWVEVYPGLKLGIVPGAASWPVMPISRQGTTRARWNQVLLRLQIRIRGLVNGEKGVEKLAQSEIDHLDIAWEDARQYYDEEKPLGTVLESLFPFFIDATNHLIEPLHAADWDASKRAAKAAIRKIEKQFEQLPEAPEDRSNAQMNAGALQRVFSNDADVRKMRSAIDSDPAEFVNLFRKLSSRLTEVMIPGSGASTSGDTIEKSDSPNIASS